MADGPTYFFMVPPGEAASPFLSTAPAVPAPCVLASLEEGFELPVVVSVAAPLFIAGAAPVCGLAPDVPVWAKAAVPVSARAVASEMILKFMVVSWLMPR